MPDHSAATTCPHCGEEVGMGHYVCWNCSRDVRMGVQTESEIMDEYHRMVAGQEIALEERNRRFFLGLLVVFVGVAVLNLVLRGHPGTTGLFLVLALLPVWWAVKATRRIKRIERARSD